MLLGSRLFLITWPDTEVGQRMPGRLEPTLDLVERHDILDSAISTMVEPP